MKRLFTLLFLGSILTMTSQMNDPVKWSAQYKAISASEGQIVVTASIDRGWHTYSQRPTDAGPIPTSLTFEAPGNIKLDGKTEESNAHEEYVPAFEARIFVFKEKAEFRQKVKKSGTKPETVKCKVEFMSCNDNMCLPPKTVELSVKVL